jgi:hypothetical protein
MKGLGYEATSFYGANTEYISAGFFHPNVSPVPRAVARGHIHDGSPDHHQYLPYGASLRPASCLLLSAGVFAATLVYMGAGSQVADLSADLLIPTMET